MKPEWIEEVADIFQALSEPTRIRLLLDMRDREVSVGELTELSGTTMANVSKHLALMKRLGLVARRREGNHVYYSPGDRRALEMIDAVRRKTARVVETDAGEAPSTEDAHPRGPTRLPEARRRPEVSVTGVPSFDVPDPRSRETEGEIEIQQPGLEGLDAD